MTYSFTRKDITYTKIKEGMLCETSIEERVITAVKRWRQDRATLKGTKEDGGLSMFTVSLNSAGRRKKNEEQRIS
jgi:hypothetical protein